LSKEVQDIEIIMQGVGICLLGQRWNSACRLSGKGCTHHGKVLCCHLVICLFIADFKYDYMKCFMTLTFLSSVCLISMKSLTFIHEPTVSRGIFISVKISSRQHAAYRHSTTMNIPWVPY
jgi:hypothetical protein